MSIKFVTVPVVHRKWQVGDEFFIKNNPTDIHYRIESREIPSTDGDTKEYEYCIRKINNSNNITDEDYLDITNWYVSPKLAVYGLTEKPNANLALVRKIEWSD